jgi:triosephosphate isomerase (TIM)
MRKSLIAGNWKMHGSREGVQVLLEAIKKGADAIDEVQLAIFPPYVFLQQTQTLLQSTQIAWGAQNLSSEHVGAFTGEVSADMLREFGCHYVLVGHSERRSLFAETNALIARKFQVAVTTGLSPILCLGETLAERTGGETYSVIREQLETVLALEDGITMLKHGLIAYEPVWAIGTGVTAQPEVAQEVHAKIREWVAECNKTIAQELRILYGGSVKRDNAAALFSMPDIDGGLIGGASLNSEEFLDIATICSNY